MKVPAQRELDCDHVISNMKTDKYTREDVLRVMAYLESNDPTYLDNLIAEYHPEYYNEKEPLGHRTMKFIMIGDFGWNDGKHEYNPSKNLINRITE